MNSGLKPTPIFIAVGALLFLCLVNQREPGMIKEESNAPSVSYTAPKKEKSTPKYKYRVEIETVPENQIYSIRKSGYQQYEVSRKGETYSYVVYEFISDKKLTDQECSDFVNNHPDKCTRIYPEKSSSTNIYDEYNDNYEDYVNDPEDEINYPPEVYDFLAD